MLVFPDGTSVECGVAFESGQTGQISEDNCRFIQDFIAATVTVANETSTIATNVCGCTGGASTCSICPPGTAISFPDGIFPLPDSIANNTASNNNEVGEDSFQCSFAQTVANTDIWTPDTCLELQLAADVNGTNPCGCQHTDESGNATTTDDVAPDNDDGTLVLDTCSICGGNSNNEEDLQVTNIDTIVPLPPLFLESLPPSLLNATDNFTCGSLEEMGQDFALWSPEVCAFLQMKSADVCECQAKPTSSNNTTPGGVAPPSPSAVDQGPESRASSVWTLSSFGSTTALAAMGAITFWMATWW